jgi:DNA-binding response OmpR family regulator/anti-sigma regulatory factor (Ser/Thr protein kinase)
LRLIRRNAQYLLRLVSQLLDLSKLESRKMRLHATRGNLVHGLEQIVIPFVPIAERHGIDLTFGASAPVPALERAEIYFDSDVLHKIFNNLIGNALKFTPSGGRVTVDVQGPQNGFVDLVVSDTGVGIPAAELPLVFERFHQVEGRRSREGIGIGLALVKELVDLHHGEIHVESQEGRGTTFIIRLRTGRAHLAPEEIVESSAAPAIDRETPAANLELDDVDDGPIDNEAVEEPDDETTVLIVEDHGDVRTFLREHLQRHYRVLEATNGSEGLERALASLPDLVLSDVVMPQMNGYELCRALKAHERTCHIPVVLLTAKTMREDRLLGLEIGADCYLVKPFDALELLVQVKNLIGQRRSLRERFGGPVVLKPSEMGVTPMDEAFLTKVLAVVQSHLQDPSFDVERLGREVGLSRSQLHRKLRALTNQPPTLLIRSIRLQRAAELLAHKTGSVAEIAYFVGFNSQAYFAKCFREQFGCSPKEYAATATAKRA